MKKIALLGLGTMGAGMGKRLLDAGFSLAVYNRTVAKAETLRKAGAIVAASPAEAARGAEVVISMLADDQASRMVWMGGEGALASVPAGAVLVECGTVTPDWVQELGHAGQEKGCVLLDAPVTGSRVQAAAGELTFLVGGPAAQLETTRPVLEAMGKKIVHVGPSGSGSRLKLINNFLCAVQLASLAEAVGWMERAGLDMDLSLDVLCTGAPGSPLLKTMSQRMMKRDYQVNFLLRLLGKDVGYAQKDAQTTGIPLHTADSTLELLERAKELGYGEQDMSSVVEQFRGGKA
jgi:3-hydroxyisobutyrate dehydrogenase